MDFLNLMNMYIKTELLIITPVLYVIARMMNTSHINNNRIPWYLLSISIILAGLYTFATSDISSIAKCLMALFTILVQGVLLSGASIYGGILAKTILDKRRET